MLLSEENQHKFFMEQALKQAQKAFQLKEVPVGAVIVRGDKKLSQAHNTRESQQDPLGHAELLAIRKASQKLGSWRLEGCKIYVSLEPCLMCMGAILQARISQLIYACPEPKAGFSSYYDLNSLNSSEQTAPPPWTKKINIRSGVRAEESSLLLKKFFKNLRQ